MRPKARRGIIPCVFVLRLEWVSFNLNVAILALRYRRPIHALEALARSASLGFLRRARRLLTALAAIHLPCGVGELAS